MMLQRKHQPPFHESRQKKKEGFCPPRELKGFVGTKAGEKITNLDSAKDSGNIELIGGKSLGNESEKTHTGHLQQKPGSPCQRYIGGEKRVSTRRKKTDPSLQVTKRGKGGGGGCGGFHETWHSGAKTFRGTWGGERTFGLLTTGGVKRRKNQSLESGLLEFRGKR